MTFYKVLETDGSARTGTGKWDLPKGGQPGRWKHVKGDLIPCHNGLHLCRKQDLIHWLGPAIFKAEYEGELVESDQKVVVRKARLVGRVETWNDRTARLFAADCADKALRDTQRATGIKTDPRARAAVRAARGFADGKIGPAELSAARDAARAATRDWQTRRLFEYLSGKRGQR